MIRSTSWTRGDGLEIFDISNPENPRYAAGFLSAGYVFDMLEYRDHYYIATCYSILIISKKDHVMVENLLISFPEGKVTDLAVAGNMLFCSSPDGLREYEILDNGRLRYKTIWTDFKELISLSASGDTVYLVKKDMPQRIFTIQPEKGQFQTPFKDVFASLLRRLH